MPARYSAAIDTLADNLRWMLSRKGIDVLEARSQYLLRHRLTHADTDSAQATLVSILSEAEPVFWPLKFCNIVEQSYGSLPESWRLTDPMLFTPSGFIHFDQPISLRPSHPRGDVCMGADDHVTAIGWRKTRGTLFVDVTAWVTPGDQSLMEIFPPKWMIRRISERTFSELDRLVKKGHERDKITNAHVSAGADKIAQHLDESLLTAVDEALTADQERYRRMMLDAHRETGVIRPGGIPWMIAPWRSGQTLAQTTAVHAAAYEDVHDACESCASAYLRLYGTCLNFLSTKVFITVPSHTDRAVLRRLARNNTRKPQWDAVNVVTLRRAERLKHPSDEEHREVEWAGHWLVGAGTGGFWRRQPVKNSLGEWLHEWRWIAPYLKGDFSKPFMPPKKRVYNVSR